MLEILGTIGFDWRVAIANLVSFLIIFFILKKYVFGPLGKTIDERKRDINDGLNKAKQSETELLVAKQKVEEELTDARNEANKIIAKAKKSGDELIDRANNEASTKVDEAMDQANKNIEKRKEQMERDLLEKTADLVTLGVAKILDEDLDDAKNKGISKRALETLKKS